MLRMTSMSAGPFICRLNTKHLNSSAVQTSANLTNLCGQGHLGGSFAGESGGSSRQSSISSRVLSTARLLLKQWTTITCILSCAIPMTLLVPQSAKLRERSVSICQHLLIAFGITCFLDPDCTIFWICLRLLVLFGHAFITIWHSSIRRGNQDVFF